MKPTIILSLLLKLDVLVEDASTVLILTYILSCLSVVVLRESGLQNYRPVFKAPLYPWLQIGGIAGLGFERLIIDRLAGNPGRCAGFQSA